MVGATGLGVQHFCLNGGTSELAAKLRLRRDIIERHERNGGSRGSHQHVEGEDSDVGISDAESEEPLSYAMLPVTARMSSSEAADFLSRVRRREDKYARLKQALRRSSAPQPPGLGSARCTQEKDSHLAKALQRAALAEARTAILQAALDGAPAPSDDDDASPSAIADGPPPRELEAEPAAVWRVAGRWRDVVERALEQRWSEAQQRALDSARHGTLADDTDCPRRSHPDDFVAPAPLRASRIRPPPDAAPLPRIPSPRAWPALEDALPLPPDRSSSSSQGRSLAIHSVSPPSCAHPSRAPRPTGLRWGALLSRGPSAKALRLRGLKDNAMEGRARPTSSWMGPLLSVAMLCCGVVYTLHGQRSPEHAFLAVLGLQPFGDLRQLALEHLGLGALAEGAAHLEPSVVERLRLGVLLPEDLDRLRFGLLRRDSEDTMLNTDELEADIERTKARAELRRQQLENVTKRVVIAIGISVVLCLFVALSFWRRLLGAVLAVLAGAVVFISLVVVADVMQGTRQLMPLGQMAPSL